MKILFLENLPYRSHITVGSHHYARLFAKTDDVMWISLPWHIAQILKDRKSDRIRNWNWNRLTINADSLKSITPFTFLPFRNNPILRNEWLCRNQYTFIPGIKRLLKKNDFLNPDIVWFSDPRHISLLAALSPQRIVYRCVDNLEEFSDVPRSLLTIEKNLIRKCDAVFFTAPLLKQKFEGLNPNSYHLPNGCDFDFFANENAPRNHQNFFKPQKLNLLYTGAIAEWMDFAALEQIAELGFVNLIMVGPIRTTIPDSLKRKENVTFTGPLPYQDMPGLVHQADIGIIPFKINRVTDYVDPIKLHEYSAGGLPCISSNFKTVREMQGAFYKYRDYDELRSLLMELKENHFSRFSAQEIHDFAIKNSWTSRINFIKTVLKIN